MEIEEKWTAVDLVDLMLESRASSTFLHPWHYPWRYTLG